MRAVAFLCLLAACGDNIGRLDAAAFECPSPVRSRRFELNGISTPTSRGFLDELTGRLSRELKRLDALYDYDTWPRANAEMTSREWPLEVSICDETLETRVRLGTDDVELPRAVGSLEPIDLVINASDGCAPIPLGALVGASEPLWLNGDGVEVSMYDWGTRLEGKVRLVVDQRVGAHLLAEAAAPVVNAKLQTDPLGPFTLSGVDDDRDGVLSTQELMAWHSDQLAPDETIKRPLPSACSYVADELTTITFRFGARQIK